ncbi:hypothetical protein HPB48_020945 [Haemaphysalis longicornis]|uniref:Myb/SANT-like DNA-binding domain-containing protein n=1 Tax=Haemaphysalis longicornis TaxID=44386 RepID=A0A9J6FZC3_HAELO|nr:hypothetical protein HPB48_020945 [Haemaphysalis longicornis]
MELVRRSKNFSVAESDALITLWSDPETQKKFDSAYRHSVIWEMIANKLRMHGYERSSIDCKTKINNLKATYFKFRRIYSAGESKKLQAARGSAGVPLPARLVLPRFSLLFSCARARGFRVNPSGTARPRCCGRAHRSVVKKKKGRGRVDSPASCGIEEEGGRARGHTTTRNGAPVSRGVSGPIDSTLVQVSEAAMF